MIDPEEHTKKALQYMARFGIRPGGQVRAFHPPEARQENIDRIPFTYREREVVVYETQPGEFTAVCPFSGLPDSGSLRLEYVPGSWIPELKSLRYYMVSYREIGATQEEISALIYQDLLRTLEDCEYLLVETRYNVRGGIAATVRLDSRAQG